MESTNTNYRGKSGSINGRKKKKQRSNGGAGGTEVATGVDFPFRLLPSKGCPPTPAPVQSISSFLTCSSAALTAKTTFRLSPLGD